MPENPGSQHPLQPVAPARSWVEPDLTEQQPETSPIEYLNAVLTRKWTVLAIAAAVLCLVAAWTFTRPKLYRASTKVAIMPAAQMGGSEYDAYLTWVYLDRYINDQLQILQTRALAERVATRLGLQGGPREILGRLSVQSVKDTNTIVVSMVGRDPALVSEWLNVYIDEFVAGNIDDSLERTKQVYGVIQARLNPLRDQVMRSEEALMEFREREEALLFADQDSNVISAQVNTLTTEYAQAKAERIRLETTLNAVRQLRASSLTEASFPEVRENETIQNLRRQRGELELELTDKLRTFKEGHPVIQDLRSRVAAIDGRIGDEIETVRTGIQSNYDFARRREDTLFDSIQQLKSQSIELSKQTLEYERLKREYDQNKTFLENMLARSKELDLSSSAIVNNVRVIEPAVPPGGPFSPDIKKNLGLALVFGLFLGVGLVLGVDFLDQTLRNPEQVERQLGLEVLSLLPKFTEEAAATLREAFQSMRTALMLASRTEGAQVLMVTSSVPSEGKTTVVFNLGKVMAAAGSRVLLIDADLRKPRLHRMINVKNVRGLTSVVLGERELSEVIHALADVPNMDLVTSGPLPPNPPELYGKPSFVRLLERARQEYDWIIIDTPPVASVTDPVVCSMVADMVVMVVEYGGARRQIVRESIRQLSRGGTRIAGVLFNKVDLARDHYYYSYYYSHYYRYGYTYGETESAGKKAEPAAKGA